MPVVDKQVKISTETLKFVDRAMNEHRMDPVKFQRINSRIDQLARDIGPSGTNGRTLQFLEALKQVFIAENINEKLYWEEVSLRSADNKK